MTLCFGIVSWDRISKTGYGAVKCDLHEKYGFDA